MRGESRLRWVSTMSPFQPDFARAGVSEIRLLKRGPDPGRFGLFLDLLVLLVVGVILSLNLLRVGPFAPATVDDESRDGSGDLEAVAYVAAEVDAYRERFGSLPQSLDVLRIPSAEKWGYEILDSGHYRLSLRSPAPPHLRSSAPLL